MVDYGRVCHVWSLADNISVDTISANQHQDHTLDALGVGVLDVVTLGMERLVGGQCVKWSCCFFRVVFSVCCAAKCVLIVLMCVSALGKEEQIQCL